MSNFISDFMKTDIEDPDHDTEFEVCYKTAIKSNGLVCLYQEN